MADVRIQRREFSEIDRRGEAFNRGLGGEKVSSIANLVEGAKSGFSFAVDQVDQIHDIQRENDPEKLAAEQTFRDLRNRQLEALSRQAEIRASNLQTDFDTIFASRRSVNRARDVGTLFDELTLRDRARGAEADATSKELNNLEKSIRLTGEQQENITGKPSSTKSKSSDASFSSQGSTELGLSPIQAAAEAELENSQADEQTFIADQSAKKLDAVTRKNLSISQRNQSEDLVRLTNLTNSLLGRMGQARLDTRAYDPEPGLNSSLSTGLQVSETLKKLPDGPVKENAAIALRQELEADGNIDKFEDLIKRQPASEQPRLKKSLNAMRAQTGLLTKDQTIIQEAGLPIENVEDPEGTLDSINRVVQGGFTAIESPELKTAIRRSPTATKWLTAIRQASNGGQSPVTLQTGDVAQSQQTADIASQDQPAVTTTRIAGPGAPQGLEVPNPQRPEDEALVSLIEKSVTNNNNQVGRAQNAQQSANNISVQRREEEAQRRQGQIAQQPRREPSEFGSPRISRQQEIQRARTVDRNTASSDEGNEQRKLTELFKAENGREPSEREVTSIRSAAKNRADTHEKFLEQRDEEDQKLGRLSDARQSSARLITEVVNMVEEDPSLRRNLGPGGRGALFFAETINPFIPGMNLSKEETERLVGINNQLISEGVFAAKDKGATGKMMDTPREVTLLSSAFGNLQSNDLGSLLIIRDKFINDAEGAQNMQELSSRLQQLGFNRDKANALLDEYERNHQASKVIDPAAISGEGRKAEFNTNNPFVENQDFLTPDQFLEVMRVEDPDVRAVLDVREQAGRRTSGNVRRATIEAIRQGRSARDILEAQDRGIELETETRVIPTDSVPPDTVSSPQEAAEADLTSQGGEGAAPLTEEPSPAPTPTPTPQATPTPTPEPEPVPSDTPLPPEPLAPEETTPEAEALIEELPSPVPPPGTPAPVPEEIVEESPTKADTVNQRIFQRAKDDPRFANQVENFKRTILKDFDLSNTDVFIDEATFEKGAEIFASAFPEDQKEIAQVAFQDMLDDVRERNPVSTGVINVGTFIAQTLGLGRLIGSGTKAVLGGTGLRTGAAAVASRVAPSLATQGTRANVIARGAGEVLRESVADTAVEGLRTSETLGEESGSQFDATGALARNTGFNVGGRAIGRGVGLLRRGGDTAEEAAGRAFTRDGGTGEGLSSGIRAADEATTDAVTAPAAGFVEGTERKVIEDAFASRAGTRAAARNRGQALDAIEEGRTAARDAGGVSHTRSPELITSEIKDTVKDAAGAFKNKSLKDSVTTVFDKGVSNANEAVNKVSRAIFGKGAPKHRIKTPTAGGDPRSVLELRIEDFDNVVEVATRAKRAIFGEVGDGVRNLSKESVERLEQDFDKVIPEQISDILGEVQKRVPGEGTTALSGRGFGIRGDFDYLSELQQVLRERAQQTPGLANTLRGLEDKVVSILDNMVSSSKPDLGKKAYSNIIRGNSVYGNISETIKGLSTQKEVLQEIERGLANGSTDISKAVFSSTAKRADLKRIMGSEFGQFEQGLKSLDNVNKALTSTKPGEFVTEQLATDFAKAMRVIGGDADIFDKVIRKMSDADVDNLSKFLKGTDSEELLAEGTLSALGKRINDFTSTLDTGSRKSFNLKSALGLKPGEISRIEKLVGPKRAKALDKMINQEISLDNLEGLIRTTPRGTAEPGQISGLGFQLRRAVETAGLITTDLIGIALAKGARTKQQKVIAKAFSDPSIANQNEFIKAVNELIIDIPGRQGEIASSVVRTREGAKINIPGVGEVNPGALVARAFGIGQESKEREGDRKALRQLR